MTDHPEEKVRRLMEKGVRIPAPASVEIGDEVALDRIAGTGVVIHAGSRIRGRQTLLMDGVRIGEEAPATVEDCCAGPGVRLKGGFFSGAVFLNGAGVGSSAHVRPGTILEERASAAHAAGLKQSILFPYVTIGSLVNFCDVLMAGGTGPKNHSEVGSAYIHFNFTPNQDKATASLLGNVPGGVMLDQDPVFLGGQGGLVGPRRLTFGTVIAAGTVYRKDELQPGRLLTASGGRGGSVAYSTGVYPSIKRLVANNLIYFANLLALAQWYRHARRLFIGPEFSENLWTGLQAALDTDIRAHVRQFEGFVGKLPGSIERLRQGIPTAPGDRLIDQQAEMVAVWPDMSIKFKELCDFPGNERLRDVFLKTLSGHTSDGYLPAIHGLSEAEKVPGRQWLEGIVSQVTGTLEGMLPAIFDRSE